MDLQKPDLYRQYEDKFNSLKRENMGASYTWKQLAKFVTLEVVPLLYRTTDLWFLKGKSSIGRDKAIAYYAISTWMQYVDVMAQAAKRPYLWCIYFDETDYNDLPILWPSLMYVPDPQKNFMFGSLRWPRSSFGRQVCSICEEIVDPSVIITLESKGDEGVRVNVDFNSDGGEYRVKLAVPETPDCA